MHEWIHTLVTWVFGFVRDQGYTGVFLMMAAESSILPVPSEVVIPPAAYWASQGHMSFWGVVFAGTAGSLAGAIVMYAVSRWLGRPLVVRYGKWLRITPEKLARTEHFLERYELGGIFFARLLPVVRHLIGIPAGIVRMRVLPYCAMTVLGSFVWCTVLAWFGQKVLGDEPRLMEDPEALGRAMKGNMLWIIVGIVVLALLYVLMTRMTQRKPGAAS